MPFDKSYLTADERKAGTLTVEEATQLASNFIASSRGSLTFQSLANRDMVVKRIRSLAPAMKLDRGSIRNQSLDPRYTVEGSDLPDKGLGNSRTMYGTLYKLDARYGW